MINPNNVATHYTRTGLAALIDNALADAGIDAEHPDLESLAGVDQFHIRGLDATREFFQRAGFAANDRVLDVGSGLGGPARYLAHSRGCRVTGLDLTQAYCEIAEKLTGRVGLSEQVNFRHGNALEMPFENASFDGVYTQHVNMNIADKPRLLREIRRVLKPGGRLAMYEILAGNGEPLRFPVPWAQTPDISFLVTADALGDMLAGEGFTVEQREDQSPQAIQFFIDLLSGKGHKEASPVGLHLLLGAGIKDMMVNMLENFEEGRLGVVQMILRR